MTRGVAVSIVITFFLLALAALPVWLSFGDNFFVTQSKYEVFGIDYNRERARLGIPLLPDEWYTKETSVIPRSKFFRFRFWTLPNYWYAQVWSDFDSSAKIGAYHKEKEIQRNIKSIDIEIDRFKNVINDTTELLLEIKYNYLYEGDSSWSASIIKTIDTKDDYLVDAKDVTLVQADSILSTWKLSRRNK